MDEQARAIFVLAAATLAAAQIQTAQRSNPEALHDDTTAAEVMMRILRQMEAQGVVPAGVETPTSKPLNFRTMNPAR